MKKTIPIYALAIALAALALQWIDYQYTVRAHSREIYVGAIALLFTALGIWVGHRLASGRRPSAEEGRNERAIESLGISERELEVLTLLAEGFSNREIGERLFVSTNTVKSHLAHLYDKLEVQRRTQAVQKARMLGILG